MGDNKRSHDLVDVIVINYNQKLQVNRYTTLTDDLRVISGYKDVRPSILWCATGYRAPGRPSNLLEPGHRGMVYSCQA